MRTREEQHGEPERERWDLSSQRTCGRVIGAAQRALVHDQFSGTPADEIAQIAAHIARRVSGCVGRSAAGRNLDHAALRLAVIAHIRHSHTPYDELLMTGCPRRLARQKIALAIDRTLAEWGST